MGELQLLNEIDNLKGRLVGLRHLMGEKVARAFDLEYTYESNRKKVTHSRYRRLH